MAGPATVRRIALALPDTVERPSYGTPGFFVKKMLFARLHIRSNAGQFGKPVHTWSWQTVTVVMADRICKVQPISLIFTIALNRHIRSARNYQHT